jgi:uncharacterized protein (TIGR03067 family)
MSMRVCIPLLALFLAGVAWSQGLESEIKSLAGTWTPTSGELGGQPFPEAVLKATKLVVDGNKYTVTVGDQVDRGVVKIDATKKPKTMDITGEDGPNKGKTFLCIYELNGDTLKVCYDLSGKARPEEFKSKEKTLIFLATYKRAK